MAADAADHVWGNAPGSALHCQVSSFVGREHDVRDVLEALGDARLVTLTGPGGCGKTRLALEVASRWPSGVGVVELASLARGADVAVAVADGLGVRPLPGETENEAIVRHLDRRAALLVLDNVEHVLESARALCTGVLARCSGVRVLATSRSAMRVVGEVDWRVPPLGLPPLGLPGADARSVLDSDAVRLFVERARLVDRHFAVGAASAASVVEMCRRLDGMPLAIEFAAARLRTLSLTQIVERLDAALSLSGPGRPSGDSRQRTLRASIDWSHDLLGVEEQVLLRRLGVFAGGFSLPLVEAVCAGAPLRRDRILDLLEALIVQSLVTVVERGLSARYRLHETVRQFAAERTEDAGERVALRHGHRDAMVAVAAEQQKLLRTPDQPAALDALDRDAPNLAAAMDWAVQSEPDLALLLCVALDQWWRVRGHVREGKAAFDRALSAGEPNPSALRCRALIGRAWIHDDERELTDNIARTREALSVAEHLADVGLVTEASLALSNCQLNADPAQARALLVRCWTSTAEAEDDWVLARCALDLAQAEWYLQDQGELQPWRAGSAERLVRLGDRSMRAFGLIFDAGPRHARGELHPSDADLLAAVGLAREVSDPWAEGSALLLLVLADCTAGRPRPARAEIERLRAEIAGLGGSVVLVWVWLVNGVACAADGDLTAAVGLLETVVDGGVGACRMPQIWARLELAEVLRLAGRRDAAGHAESALTEAQALGNPWLVARAHLLLGRLRAREGRWIEADQLHHRALDAITGHGLRLELPGVLEALAEVAEARRGAGPAARLLAAAAAVRTEDGLVAWPAQRAEVDTLVARVGRGEQMPPAAVEDVVAWVRRSRGRRGRPERGWESLTPAELAVVRHAAAGRTNREIAAAMFVSSNTVKTHLSRVFGKLGVRTRAELIALGARHQAS